MKKIIIAGLIILSNAAFAQESSDDNVFVYKEPVNQEEDDTFPGNPGDPETAPIDQYVPVLILVAAGIIVGYSKRKKLAE